MQILSLKTQGWLKRKLLRLANRLDPDKKTVYQAGEFKFEHNWKQPVSKTDTAAHTK